MEAANRRRSEREMPGAPRQTWYCSVSFFANRKLGVGAFTSGRRTGGHVRVLAGGGGVPLPAEAVEDLRDLLGRVVLRALEEEMLDEVRDAGLRVCLVP